ncbi:hypothetical protein PAL_GLEAN10026117 [Pteropus alecto]|uniref:Uncharacterized protein n=1 Tax=Pteropus alecto TaxID=9402 RepID=L5K2X1_PTEAL|nr:hypothetical protein PAL_GLEAN10026117 [Pteropus alecto]
MPRETRGWTSPPGLEPGPAWLAAPAPLRLRLCPEPRGHAVVEAPVCEAGSAGQVRGSKLPAALSPPKLSPLAALTSLVEFPNTRHPPAPAPSATFCEFATKSPQSRPRKKPLQKQMLKLRFVLGI